MTRTWIKVKQGILEKKHRDAMGSAVWLYLYMLDIVNWDTGVIPEWKDRVHSVDADMNIETLRKHRVKLYDEGYITCHQHHDDQTIILHNYTNPREYSGEVYNEDGVVQSEVKNSKRTTPTSNSHLNNISLKKNDLMSLRTCFSEHSGIAQPKWSKLDSASRKKYGTWWNKALKNMWIAADEDVEKTKLVIQLTLQKVTFEVFAPVSIEKAFMKYVNHKPRSELGGRKEL